MDFLEYLEYLLDIAIEYKKYVQFPKMIFADSMDGSTDAVVKNLDRLLKKSPKEFNQKDLMSIWYIIKKVNGGKKMYSQEPWALGKLFPKPKKEITHDIKCENCGDPATVNYQLVWVSWNIKPDGDYENQEFHDSDTNEFWCSRCWELDRNEEYDKLKEIRDEWNARLSKL